MLLPEHYPIVLAMLNPFDYPSFLALCRSKNVMVLSMQDYQESIDNLFPGRRDPQSNRLNKSVGASPRSCCGGGKSR